MTNPNRKPYRTSDGHVAVAVYTDRHWQRFFAAIGRPEVMDDPRFADIYNRTQHIDTLYAMLAREFPTRSTAEWLQILTEADIPVMTLNSPDTLAEDPHMKAVGFITEQDHPSEGRIQTLGIPQQWSESPPAIRHPRPAARGALRAAARGVRLRHGRDRRAGAHGCHQGYGVRRGHDREPSP